ncbi:MAG: hypothetical protein ACE5IM_01185 [Nitrospinota bacterium]
MSVFDAFVDTVSRLRPLGFAFLAVIAGAGLHDLLAWWRVKRPSG